MNYLYHVTGASGATFAWPGSERERRRLRDEILAVVAPALTRAAELSSVPAPKHEDVAVLLEDFLAAYGRRPLPDNKGGSGLNDSLWLYCLGRVLLPALILESGTWRGQSSWLLRQACPAAEIWSFDLEVPADGRHETPDVRYVLADWTSVDCPAPRGPSLVFFDDHVSHARRLAEAAARGFRIALLDDNFAAWHLHATGAPPVPTLAMLLDETTKPGGVIEWQRNGKIYRYDDSEERRRETRDLVEAAFTLPELASVTRHPPGSGLTLVRLTPKTGF